MSISPHNQGPVLTSTGRRIVRIPKSRVVEGAQRLAGDHAAPGAGQAMVDAAASHGIELREMWGSMDARTGRIRQVCLLSPGVGRVAMAFTSQPPGRAERRELAEVIDAACAGLEGSTLVQGLLTEDEKRARGAFLDAGFQPIGGLLYLRRTWRDPSPEAPERWPRGVTVENWRRGEDAALITGLERSYEGTMDCPELCGMRRGEDVVASHRATGAFDPALWWIVRLEGEPHGALLLNRCPAQGHTELVYLGLSPALRGLGLAKGLLSMGLASLSGHPERLVTCAVDERNAPARRLYERFGFEDFALRHAVIRRAGGAAQSVDNRAGSL